MSSIVVFSVGNDADIFTDIILCLRSFVDYEVIQYFEFLFNFKHLMKYEMLKS